MFNVKSNLAMEKQFINRREFLRRLGLGSAVVGTGVALQSCTGGAVNTKDIISDFDPAGSPFSEDQLGEMTYRINPNNGDKVSLLGYGMMRLPQTVGQNQGAGENSIDQEQTNKLVKYYLSTVEQNINPPKLVHSSKNEYFLAR